ncbi:PAS domain-containing protein [Ruminococcus sp. CLA-AA-H200]|uniref:PAS domain-containing protein n=1 Tax=Ruminococcus turbiniformis TaxID=2881258 RepID=A0ABS8G267_9FIRM|nr:PAS domain-containing protein [Ruminococcus turbiniformis]MCC2255029.1 PAS domain-containing protein [Ruminococcus turbiniformis]
MNDIIDCYKKLIPFLGKALGIQFEAALLDCRLKEIVAIENNHISGRNVGAPMTDFAQQIIDNEEWKTRDFIDNYPGYTEDGKLLRSSTFFIKSGDSLAGMLCINMDTSDYRLLSDALLKLGGLTPCAAQVPEKNPSAEKFIDSVSNTIKQTLNSLYSGNIPSRFSRDERIKILSILQEKEVFMVKGSVPRIARILGCSVPTVYRELSSIKGGDAAKSTDPGII